LYFSCSTFGNVFLHFLFVLSNLFRAAMFLMLRNLLSCIYCKEGTMWVWYLSVCLSPCVFFPCFFFPNLLSCVRLLSLWRFFCVIFLYVLVPFMKRYLYFWFKINCLNDGSPLAVKIICRLMIMIRIIVLSNISNWDPKFTKDRIFPTQKILKN
jgi:hypothetical protein